MKQKYIVRKLRRRPDADVYFWNLYCHDPVDNMYHAEGQFFTVGQLLCHMECTDLDSWHFDGQISPSGNHTITYYRYSAPPGKSDVELDVVEDTRWIGGERKTEDKIVYELSPAELHEIWCLLGDKKAELKCILESDKLKDAETAVSFWEWYDRVNRLEVRIRFDERRWFNHEPDHPYTVWRLEELERIADYITGCNASWSREKQALKNAYLEQAIEDEKKR